MSEEERKVLREAVRSYRQQEQALHNVEQKLAVARGNVKSAYEHLSNLVPHGETAVVRFGPKTLVVSRDRNGIGDVQIVDAAVA